MLLAVIRQESAFDVKAVSSAGALGLMQLMPFTAKHVAKTLKTKYPAYSGTSQYFIQGINFVFLTPYLVRRGVLCLSCKPL